MKTTWCFQRQGTEQEEQSSSHKIPVHAVQKCNAKKCVSEGRESDPCCKTSVHPPRGLPEWPISAHPGENRNKKVFFLSLNGISCISALSTATRVLLHLFILRKINRLGVKQLITESYTVPMTLKILRYTELLEQCFALKYKLSFDMQTGKYWVVTRLQLTPTLALLKSFVTAADSDKSRKMLTKWWQFKKKKQDWTEDKKKKKHVFCWENRVYFAWFMSD